MCKRGTLAALFFLGAVVLVIAFGIQLWLDYTTRYPYGSAPFYVYVVERAIDRLVPAGLCIAAGGAVKREKK